MNEEFEKKENEAQSSGEEHVYKTVMDMKSRSRAWSVAALAVAVFSIVCCCFGGWPSIVLGAIAIVFAVISRINIGYFDNLSIAALIVAIFGMVFGIAMTLLTFTLESSPEYQEYLKELEKMMNEQGGAGGGVI